MKKQLLVKLLSFIMAVILLFTDFTAYASAVTWKTVSGNTLSGNTLSDNSISGNNYSSKGYTPYWDENGNFSNLIVFVDFADVSEEHSYDPHYIELFDGDEENVQGLRDYFYKVSHESLKIETIIPQYDYKNEQITALTLQKAKAEYALDNTFDEKAFLKDIVKALNDTELLTEEMNLHCSDLQSQIVDYLTIVVPSEEEEERFTSHNGCYEQEEEILLGEDIINNYCIITEDDLLSEEASLTINALFWERLGYVNQTEVSVLNYPTADFRASQLGWFEIPVLTESQNAYTLVEAGKTEKENAESQAVILKTALSDTEYFIIEYRQDLSEGDGASDLLIYRVDAEAVFGRENEAGRIQIIPYGDKLLYANGDRSNIEIKNISVTDKKITFDISFGKPEKIIVGWHKEGNYYYYYDKTGNKLKGVVGIDGKNYYFDDNYRLATGWKKINGKYRFFNNSTDYKKCHELSYTGKEGGWVTLSDGRKSYIHPSKGILKGMQSISSKKYYFDAVGIMKKNSWQKSGEYYYYATGNGSMATGVVKIDGKNYYFNSNCCLSTGWYKISGKYRFFDNNSNYKNRFELTYKGKSGGWITLPDGRKSYIHSKNGVYKGLKTISGKMYYFDSVGIMKKNSWQKSGDYYYYATNNGSVAKGVVKISGKNYYFDRNCRLSTGWKKIGGKYRFFNNVSNYKNCYELSYTDNGNPGGFVRLSDGRHSYINLTKGPLKGWQTILKKRYYFDSVGILQKNSWRKAGNYYYYATSNGSMAKGAIKISGKTYYFDSNCRLSTGWKKIGSKYRFFNNVSNYKNRYELTYVDNGNPGGWVTLSDGRKSFIHPSKGVLKGWQTLSKNKYYFNSTGIMLSGWQTISGKKYFFNLSGIYIPMTKPTISSVTSSAYGKATIKWNKITGVDDYVVQYSTNSKFASGVVTKKLDNTTSNQLTVTGLSANKTYYFRVKYSAQGGNKKSPVTATSSYSVAKSIKIKGEVTATATSAVISTCKITSGSRDGGITVQFKATLKDRLKSGDKKYYIVQTASYGTAIDVKTPCASVDKNFTVSVNFNINGSGVNQALMNKFALAIKKSDGIYQVVSTPKGITNPEFISENKTAILKPVSKKGLQGVGFADASDTNSKHTLFNLDLAKVVSATAKSGYVAYQYKGKTYYFSDCSNLIGEMRQMAEGYDQYIQGMTGKKNKIAVTLNILLSYNSTNKYLIDPAARKVGYRYYTLNVREEKARETLEAVFMYLGEIFGQEDCYVTHWILGNEVNSSNAYNYAGSLTQNQYMQCYAAAFRLLYNGVKASKTGNNVYISLDNGWCAAPDTYTGKSTLDKFASYAQKENPSMLWSIAYHGYSYPLTRNDFWNDSSNTTNSTSTKYISMKNISVLTKYAATLEQKYSKPSGSIRVILSEQGYNAGKGEYSQAEALARGYYIAEFNNRIDAFIIRAIQDAKEEVSGGLKLGVKDIYDAKRTSYYVYEYMDSNLSKFKKNVASQMVSSRNVTRYQDAQKILCKTNWKSIISGFNVSKLNAMY